MMASLDKRFRFTFGLLAWYRRALRQHSTLIGSGWAFHCVQAEEVGTQAGNLRDPRECIQTVWTFKVPVVGIFLHPT